MKLKFKHSWYEHFIYAILWIFIFALPVLDFWHNRNMMTNMDISEVVYHSWLFLLPLFLIFVINDLLLAPYLLLKRRVALYLISVSVLVFVVLFSFSFIDRGLMSRTHLSPVSMDEQVMQQMRDGMVPPETGGQPPIEADPNFEAMRQQPRQGDPAGSHEEEQHIRPEEGGPDSLSFAKSMNRRPHHLKGNRADNGWRGPRGNHPDGGMMLDGILSPPMAPMLGRFFIALFMLGFNVAIKFVFRSIRQEQTAKEQEKQKLQSELEYLKYQINPHFFMNTLNNIHALIDIDPVKAQETILELSKMMRYVLYDSSNRLISLEKEITFLRNYIGLMSLRYTDKVKVSMNAPDLIPEVLVPPLMFIPFVENAFKHGVSYQQKSFINVYLEVEQDKVIFRCENSQIKNADEKKKTPGIGIENTRRRLNLLFGTDYTLSIQSEKELFKVLLIIPTVC